MASYRPFNFGTEIGPLTPGGSDPIRPVAEKPPPPPPIDNDPFGPDHEFTGPDIGLPPGFGGSGDSSDPVDLDPLDIKGRFGWPGIELGDPPVQYPPWGDGSGHLPFEELGPETPKGCYQGFELLSPPITRPSTTGPNCFEYVETLKRARNALLNEQSQSERRAYLQKFPGLWQCIQNEAQTSCPPVACRHCAPDFPVLDVEGRATSDYTHPWLVTKLTICGDNPDITNTIEALIYYYISRCGGTGVDCALILVGLWKLRYSDADIDSLLGDKEFRKQMLYPAALASDLDSSDVPGKQSYVGKWIYWDGGTGQVIYFGYGGWPVPLFQLNALIYPP